LLPGTLSTNVSSPAAATRRAHGSRRSSSEDDADPILTEDERVALMAWDIRRALKLTQGRVSGADGAAALLGLKPTTLASRMKTLSIRRD
jgi:transcriptional regulator with GAF, ATPase, and Fis domain